jgi:transposase
MAKRHVVGLTDDEREALEQREAGPLTRRQRYRVQILLRADAGETDEEIADAAGVSIGTVANVRRRFAAGGLDAALTERPRPGAAPLLDGKAEAIVIATACGPVPEGRATWTARMLANRLAELQVVESVSEDTILRVLKKAT